MQHTPTPEGATMPGTHTETHCHCGAHRKGSDHCPECYCEEYESTCDHVHEDETHGETEES